MITNAELIECNGEKTYIETDVTTFVLADEKYKITSFISHGVGDRTFNVNIQSIEHNGTINNWSQFPFEYTFENKIVCEFLATGHLENIIRNPNPEALMYSKSGYYELSELQMQNAVDY